MANTDAQWAAMTKLVQQMMQRGDAGNIFTKPQQNNVTHMMVLSNLVSSFSLRNKQNRFVYQSTGNCSVREQWNLLLDIDPCIDVLALF